MQSKHLKLVLSTVFTLAFLMPGLAVAQNEVPPLADSWVMTPKEGHGAELNKALAEHMKVRAEHGDPRSWQAYVPLLGDDLGRIAVRYCCFDWADQDAYDEWSDGATDVGKHFSENVAPHVANVSHMFEQMDWKNSHWEEGDAEYKLFAVTEFYLKPGMAGQFDAARDTISQIAINQGWAEGHNWIWTSNIGGKPVEAVVVPHENFASMGRDDESFMRFLADKLGSDEKAASLMAEFSEATVTQKFQIWEHRKELSMSAE